MIPRELGPLIKLALLLTVLAMSVTFWLGGHVETKTDPQGRDIPAATQHTPSP